MVNDLNIKLIKIFKSKLFFKNKKSLTVIYNYLLFIILFTILFSMIYFLEDFFNTNIENENSKLKGYNFALDLRQEILSTLEIVNSSRRIKVTDSLLLEKNLIYIDSQNSIELLAFVCSPTTIYEGEEYDIFFNGSCVQLLN